MDNNIKDFLIDAQKKFGHIEDVNTMNVLVVCSGDIDDVQDSWRNLYGHQGLFKEDSYADSSEYNEVDAILLTNLYHRHHNIFNKTNIGEHWKLENAFNLLCLNHTNQNKTKKGYAINNFLNKVSNYSYELSKFNVSGNIDQDVKDKIRIKHFVKEKLERNNIFLF